MNYNNLKPSVGVGVIVEKNGLLLLGKRISGHGSNTWQFPGGHLNYGESFFECARREVKEECNISIKNLKIGPTTNDVFLEDSMHCVTVFVISSYNNGELSVCEPTKCLEWKWFELNKMPRPLFLPIVNLIERIGFIGTLFLNSKKSIGFAK